MLKVYRPSNGILFHTLDANTVLEHLNTTPAGLTEAEVQKRRQIYGSNVLEQEKKKSILQKFFEHFKSIMVVILLAAALVALIAGDYKSTAIILFVVIMNAVLGVFQESKAEKALETLKSMSSPYSWVYKRWQNKMQLSESFLPLRLFYMRWFYAMIPRSQGLTKALYTL